MQLAGSVVPPWRYGAEPDLLYLIPIAPLNWATYWSRTSFLVLNATNPTARGEQSQPRRTRSRDRRRHTESKTVSQQLSKSDSRAEQEDGSSYKEDILYYTAQGEYQTRGASNEEDDCNVQAEGASGVGDHDKRAELVHDLVEGLCSLVEWDKDGIEGGADLHVIFQLAWYVEQWQARTGAK